LALINLCLVNGIGPEGESVARVKAAKSPNLSSNTRVALIAGGTRGIGRALVATLAQRGWAIAACYRKSETEAAALESELRDAGAQLLLVRADISEPAAAEKLVRRVEDEYGRIDALVNCAGSYHHIHLMEESIEGWHDMFNQNLHPVFYLSRLVASGMMQRKWGRIVNFSIVNADQQVGQSFVTAHYIAKIGVLVLTRSLAKILAPFGITANSISPGFIETGSIPQEVIKRSFKNIPAGYLGSPMDAVSAVCYLLSDDARYVNGTNIHVSGAWGV
jgi:3-oxoacyl-[acyl-carrier protein] reductase